MRISIPVAVTSRVLVSWFFLTFSAFSTPPKTYPCQYDDVITGTKAAPVLASIWGSTGECAVAVMDMDVVLLPRSVCNNQFPDGVSTLCPNVCKFLPDHTASHSKRLWLFYILVAGRPPFTNSGTICSVAATAPPLLQQSPDRRQRYPHGPSAPKMNSHTCSWHRTDRQPGHARTHARVLSFDATL